MNKILLNDCSPQMAQRIKKLMENIADVESAVFDETRPIMEFNLIILVSDHDQEKVVQKLRKLRFATKFRNIPIILLKEEDIVSEPPYILAGATEILAVTESAAAFSQILQSYLMPNRPPLEKEMKYLKPFIESTQKVFETMAGAIPELKGVYFRNHLRIWGDVSGMISLTGEAEGAVVITFYWSLAKQIIAKIMGVREEDINAEFIHDGVGELINMICGSAKKLLLNTPYHFQLSIPTIILGWGHEIGHLDHSGIAELVFDIGEKSFVIQITLIPKEK